MSILFCNELSRIDVYITSFEILKLNNTFKKYMYTVLFLRKNICIFEVSVSYFCARQPHELPVLKLGNFLYYENTLGQHPGQNKIKKFITQICFSGFSSSWVTEDDKHDGLWWKHSISSVKISLLDNQYYFVNITVVCLCTMNFCVQRNYFQRNCNLNFYYFDNI